MQLSNDRSLPEPQRVAVSEHGIASTQHFGATAAAVEILEAGGNAIDAAVAAAFALGVCEPAGSGLGGQTMMLIHLARERRTFALDGSSRAPAGVLPGVLGAEQRKRGHRATTVPSTPAVLDHAARAYGTMALAELLGPAIQLAEGGYPITPLQSHLQRRELADLAGSSAAPFFLRNGRRPHRPGAIVKQPVLAGTLRRLAEAGASDFYRGDIAREIHEDMRRNGGLLHRDDLALIPHPVERKPVSGWFEGCRVVTCPPPGAGRVLLFMLNILGHLPPERRDLDTPRGAVTFAEVARRAWLARRGAPFDPDVWAPTRDRGMLSTEVARAVAGELRGETTHLSVIDRHGNVVALTQSIERVFGACAVTPSLGFLYNDYLEAFEHEDPAHPHYLRPNAVPWASVAPTIVFRGKKPWLALGSPGSERIAPSIVQVLLRIFAGRSPMEAVTAPRLHCSTAGKVSLEASRMRDDIPRAFERRGYVVEPREAFSFYLGCVQLAAQEGARFTAVADLRRDGAAAGPARPPRSGTVEER